MFGPIDSIAFDFDGTLVNTMLSVATGLQLAVESATGRRVPIEDLIKTFGPAPRGVLEKWMKPDQVDTALQVWLRFEHEQGENTFQPFEGVENMLDELKGMQIPFGLFTGRDRPGTLRIINKLGWFNRFFTEANLVCGDDGFKAKPSPEGLLHLISQMGWTAERTLIVGDHEHDLLAGRAAGTKTAVALWDQTFAAGATNRAKFREGWDRWENFGEIDLRIPKPGSLSYWIQKERGG